MLHVLYYQLIAFSNFTKVLSLTMRTNVGIFRTFAESDSQITFSCLYTELNGGRYNFKFPSHHTI